MPYYVEFPTDPVVNVHWKKKDGPPDGGGGPSEQHITCGAWVKSMYAGNPKLPPNGFAYWVLFPGLMWPPGPPNPARPPRWYDGALYGQGFDTTPGHDPSKPAGYFPLLDPPIYLWTNPAGGWTVTYHYTGFPHDFPVRIGVWRGYSLHSLVQGIIPPPTEMGASAGTDVSINIVPDPARDKGFPVIFALVYGPAGGVWGVSLAVLLHTIPEIVQAHCCVDHEGAPVAGPCVEETTGAPPPPPWNDEDGPQEPPYEYEFSDPVYPYPVP